MRQYKIAMVQMNCEFLNIKKNVEKAKKLIEEAAKNGAALICLPEAFNTGYLGNRIPDMKKMAESLDGETITTIKNLAKRLSVHIVAPIIYKADNGEVENTAVLINDEGDIIGTYSKTHPVGDERIYLQRGENYPVWNTKLGKIGIVICYDACFPETTRILALEDAELVIVPAAWRASYYFKEWWDLNLACRALDNLVYIAAVNRTGSSGEEIFAGKSQVISPIGKVLTSAGIEEETILYEMIDLDQVKKEREFNTVLIDRHPIDYRLISEK
ncbi:MAG: nitrilase-related carbon-nitrogen hydrolase [Clostridium sp.]